MTGQMTGRLAAGTGGSAGGSGGSRGKARGMRGQATETVGRASMDEGSRKNWAGNVVFRAAGLSRPATVGELQALVARTGRIRALGTGHSFNDIADSPGAQVSVAGLPPEVEIDSAASVAQVAAGLTYAELAVRLDEKGFALGNLASLPHISVAGACATATHGSGLANAC